jgi:alkaline phosphatase D
MRMFNRRRFLQTLGALGATGINCGACSTNAPKFTSDPFTLGVASGYPSPNGVVLWTRLVGGQEAVEIPVRWEIAEDEAMHKIVASGVEQARPEWAHSVHIETKGLAPERWYWYRFTAGDAQSPIGRTRTAPDASTQAAHLRFAFASCQQYEQGYFGAYRHIVRDEPDLIAFLGDYIYESSWGREHVRKHDAGEPYTLDEYRARYALYKRDPDLQSAHRACPWIFTWDDHEVDNDYADDRPEDGMPAEQFLLRRAAAYRACYEHMPMPASMRPDGAAMRIYTDLAWGRLANFYIVDDRQYRAHQVCPRRKGGSTNVDPEVCTEIRDPSRSLLGRAQEAWLERAMSASQASWNILAQQTLMAQLDRKSGPGREFWTDGWDGYPAARRRLLEFVGERKIPNTVVIGGDVHSNWVADLKPDFDDEKSPVVASEFCGTSITSQGPSQKQIDDRMAENPHIKHGNGRRGYVRVDVTPQRWLADLRTMETVKVRDAACNTLVSYAVESGKPGPQRA